MKSQTQSLYKYILQSLLLVAFLLTNSSLVAQDFRVFTRTYDLSQPGLRQKPPVIVRSITLFHAGKSYDFLSSVGEVSIFDPAHDRFVILNTKRELATTVHFDQINHHLKMAHQITNEHIEQLEQQSQEKQIEATAAIKMLKFQLNPQFEETYKIKNRQLLLQGTGIRYISRCDDSVQQEMVNAYLNYTDWMARLNYVLHPGFITPDSRLRLNKSLKERKLIPIEVELKTNELHLRAEHQIRWELGTRDRTLIDSWEKQLKSDRVKMVSFHEYQRVMVAEQAQ